MALAAEISTIPSRSAATAAIQQIPPLPHVVWRSIAKHLGDDLPTLFNVATLSVNLKDICRPYISRHFETVLRPKAPLPRSMYYHRLLQLIFEAYLDPTFIFEFYTCAKSEAYRSSGDVDLCGGPRYFLHETLPRQPPKSAEEVRDYEGMIEDVVHTSPFVAPGLQSELLMRFRSGNPDAALAVLLPLCTKLKMLEIPSDAPLCAAVIQNISRESFKRGIEPDEARRQAWSAALEDRTADGRVKAPRSSSRPLGELLVLCVIDWTYQGCSFDLTQMTAFMGIPSLHRIVLDSVRDTKFASWPADHIHCSCPEIWLQKSSVPRRTILSFAEGLAGPCEVRQWHRKHPDWDDDVDLGHLTWDTLLVRPSENGQNRHVETRIAHAGGHPGRDHAWVSWLFHEKMRDWKQLDEPFAPEEGDETEEELFWVF